MYEFATHQKLDFERFKDLNCGALLWKMGAGKTFLSVHLVKYKYENLNVKKIIVFAPSATLNGWKREFLKFWPECPLPILLSNNSGPKRKKEMNAFLQNSKGIILINYESLTTDLRLSLMQFKADMLICDESHNVKNHKAKRSKYLLELRKQVKNCFLLTGTPMLNSLTDLFMQFNIMDLGKTFGSNYYVFLRRYLVDKNAHFSHAAHYFPNWVTRQETLPEVQEKIKSVCSIVKEVKGLPPVLTKTYEVSLTSEQKKVYKELEKNLITEIKQDEFITVENALAKVLRLNMICAGHLSSENHKIVFEKTEKVSVLSEILESIFKDGGKVIIWCTYKEDIKIVTKAIKDLGIHDILHITGDQTSVEKGEAEYEFTHNPRFQVIVASLQAAAVGLNLQVAQHSVNYSRTYSLGLALQSEARNYRRGTAELHDSVIRHEIYVKDSIEEIIMENLSCKKSLAETILSDSVELKKQDKEFKEEILRRFMNG
jgi:SNF2 family DNA or RNA helicase